jgi:magnesium-transporting ATPase (P-type)
MQLLFSRELHFMDDNLDKSNSKTINDTLFNRITNWLVIIGASLFSANFLIFMGYFLWQDTENNWIIATFKDHFAATIGLFLAAIAALCLVFLLKYTTGPIEFEGLGFKFKGASGPIIMWVICFLAISVAIEINW